MEKKPSHKAKFTMHQQVSLHLWHQRNFYNYKENGNQYCPRAAYSNVNNSFTKEMRTNSATFKTFVYCGSQR